MGLLRGEEGWKRSRLIVLAAVTAVVAVAATYTVRRLSEGGKVTEVGVDRAVEEFREQVATTGSPATTTEAPATTQPTGAVTRPDPSAPPETAATTTPPPAPAATLPAPGVYAYITSGYDQVDALTGARHDYPALTTLTVTPEGDCVRLRWDVAVERWDTNDWCLEGDAIQLVAMTGVHEFFGVVGRKDLTCSGDPRPLDAEPGTTWATTCIVPDTDASTYRGRVVERTSLTVEDTEVPVLHVLYEVDIAGTSTGSQTVEGWYRTSDGLPVREIVVVNTSQGTVIGTANFEERSMIELVSLTPLT